jgi:hypothetical protein
MSTKAIENDLYSSDLFSSDQSLNKKEISSNLQGRKPFHLSFKNDFIRSSKTSFHLSFQNMIPDQSMI